MQIMLELGLLSRARLSRETGQRLSAETCDAAKAPEPQGSEFVNRRQVPRGNGRPDRALRPMALSVRTWIPQLGETPTGLSVSGSSQRDQIEEGILTTVGAEPSCWATAHYECTSEGAGIIRVHHEHSGGMVAHLNDSTSAWAFGGHSLPFRAGVTGKCNLRCVRM